MTTIVADVAPELKTMLEPIDKVRTFDGNPRRGDVETIRESLRTHGQYVPILARKETSEILRGNHVHQAAIEEGWTHIAVLWRSVTSDDDAKRIVAVDNRTSDLATYEWPDLAQLLSSFDGDLAGTGFTPTDFSELLRDHNLLDAHRGIEQPDVPPVPAKPTTRRGDLIELGDHRLLCGDSTNPGDVATLCAGETVDFIFTSPPYNVGVRYSDHDDETAPWPEYAAFLRSIVDAWLPHLGAGRALGWNIGATPAIHPHRQAVLLEDAGLTYLREIIWRKQGVPLPKWHHTQRKPAARRFTPNPVHELIYLYAKGPALDVGPKVTIDNAAQHDVIDLHQSQATRDVPAGKVRSGSRQSERLQTRAFKAHPAVFPVKLPALFARHLAAPGEIVADPMVGAGSTILAAHQLEQRGLGMELDPAYCDVAVDRWETLTGEKAKRPRRRRAPAKAKTTTKRKAKT